MVVDESDTCCSKPHCTGPDAAKIVIIPVYGEYRSQMGVAQPPPTKDRFAGTGGYFGPESGMHTILEFGSTVPPPTAGDFTAGGVGELECRYIYVLSAMYKNWHTIEYLGNVYSSGNGTSGY